jgi:hypothetical protein
MPITEDTWHRIGLAMAETRGRPVDDIDYEADAVAHEQRSRVRIELRQYHTGRADEFKAGQIVQAEKAFRAELERAMRGPDKVLDGLRAINQAREGSLYHLTRTEQALAMMWPKALERAIAAGRRGLDDVPGAWFEVKLYTPPPPPRPALPADAAPPKPAQPPEPQGSLF